MAKRAALQTEPTFQTKISRAAGFTLIELMVVVAIIAATVGVALPRIKNLQNKQKEVLRSFVAISRQLHQKSKLNGFTYRIVIDMKDGVDGKQSQGFWVEKSESGSLVKPGEEKLKEEKDRDGKVKKPTDFYIDATITKEPKLLPSGMHFDKVELSRLPEPIKTGKAYIHYLPQGLAEESAIHIKGEKDQKWTIAIHPLTGRAEVISDSMALQDLRSQ